MCALWHMKHYLFIETEAPLCFRLLAREMFRWIETFCNCERECPEVPSWQLNLYRIQVTSFTLLPLALCLPGAVTGHQDVWARARR